MVGEKLKWAGLKFQGANNIIKYFIKSSLRLKKCLLGGYEQDCLRYLPICGNGEWPLIFCTISWKDFFFSMERWILYIQGPKRRI